MTGVSAAWTHRAVAGRHYGWWRDLSLFVLIRPSVPRVLDNIPEKMRACNLDLCKGVLQECNRLCTRDTAPK
jgi:hypothetical protein